MPKSPEVNAWFARYENPMKPVVERVRELVLAADRRIQECIKWQAPTFTYQGNLATFFPKSKQHASLMFHTGAQIPGDHPLLTGGGGTSRLLKLRSVADANAAKRDIERLVKAWCDLRDGVAGAGFATRASGSLGTREAAGKAPNKKALAKSAPPKKAPTKKAPTKKAPTKKAPTKKAPTKKAPTKKAPTKKAPARR